MKGALKAMPIKTDRRDGEGIARLLHIGWFRPGHCKSVSAQEVRALLGARKAIQQGMIALTPSRHQSGERDVIGGITKAGDVNLRRALCQAATVMLHRGRPSWLRTWAARVAKRRGSKRAMVALARRIGVVLHRMRRDGTEFNHAIPPIVGGL